MMNLKRMIIFFIVLIIYVKLKDRTVTDCPRDRRLLDESSSS